LRFKAELPADLQSVLDLIRSNAGN
jgi:uncharacterized membrane protein